MGKVQPLRDVSYVIQVIRNFLLGRTHTTPLRFESLVSARTQPQPAIPDGVSHKVALDRTQWKDFEEAFARRHVELRDLLHAHNYYYSRDARRDVMPPMDVTKKLLEASSDKGAPKQPTVVVPTPGKIFHWDQHY